MIFIKEILPNPIGNDASGEWIRISNDGEEQSLLGWYLKDQSGSTHPLSGIGVIKRDEVVQLDKAVTDIALNNDGDTIFLYNPAGEEMDSLVYTNAIEGEIISSNVAPTAQTAIKETAQIKDVVPFDTTIFSVVLIGIAVGLIAAFVFNLVLKDHE